MSETSQHGSGAAAPPAGVVPLNDGAALYHLLAARIRGEAVDWPEAALTRLEQELLARYGPELGGHPAVRRLVQLATAPAA